MRVAIHQPNFCPTKGYFDKIASVDLFVIMIHCQWEKGKYQNRFHVGEQWNTMSVAHGLDPIKEKVYTSPEEDWKRIVKRYPKLDVFTNCVGMALARTNICIIKRAMDMLNIKTEIALDYETELRSTERLVDICNTYHATEYLSGRSGRNYLDVAQFEKIGCEVSFQDNPDLTPLVNLI
jgi:hypothetical protein